jgi:hypothetical protein
MKVSFPNCDHCQTQLDIVGLKFCPSCAAPIGWAVDAQITNAMKQVNQSKERAKANQSVIRSHRLKGKSK